jgi:hypothetical protein
VSQLGARFSKDWGRGAQHPGGSLVGEQARIVNRMKAALSRLGIRGFNPKLKKAAERLNYFPKPCAMPPQNRVGLNHAGRPELARPQARHPDDQDRSLLRNRRRRGALRGQY